VAARITGTHVYTWLKCPTAVAHDLHGDRSLRRDIEDWEEFVRKRGRDFEERFVADMEVAEPEYQRGEFAEGAAATAALMRDGVEWIFQGVLHWVDPADGVLRLGLPDLMRKVAGASALGEHHYEVIDVKTSGRPRGDQILQVVFYSRILAEMQGRGPAQGGLILKDGREERFAVGDYRAALAEVEAGIVDVLQRGEGPRAMHSAECAGCSWSAVCTPALEADDDLSLIQGMTRGLRTTLTEAGFSRSAHLLVSASTVARRAGLEGALARRLVAAARARSEGRPVPETARRAPLGAAAILHLLSDPFEDRVLWMGALSPAAEEGTVISRCPPRDKEWQAFQEILRELPDRVPLLHYGGRLPAWHERHAHGRSAGLGAERRFVDLGRQLRGAAVYPGAIFGLAEHVRFGLGRDPHRAGNGRAAALWASEDEDGGAARLEAKGRADLLDLAALRRRFLAPAAEASAEAGT